MAEPSWRFELLYTGHRLFHPNDTYLVYRSDHMVGDGGCVMVLSVGTNAKTEVEYGALSRLVWREVTLDGVPVVRIRRALNGDIQGEWAQAAPSSPTASPPDARQHEPQPGTPVRNAGPANPSPGPTFANALQELGTVLGRSQGSGWRTLGALLSDVSQKMTPPAEAAGPAQTAEPPLPPLPPLPAVPPLAARLVNEPAAMPPASSRPAVPGERRCEQCANFRPYTRISERFAQELGPNTNDDVVARALNDLISQEERGKGEEAKFLATLYKRGADRWGDSAPSFFRYCAAHARDAAEPTYFIAQIRNPNARCEPVRRGGGQQFTQAKTDFVPRDGRPHDCRTCVHRVRARGPAEDAKEIRDIVAGAIQSSGMAAAYGKGADTSLLSSFPEGKRRNAAAARAREIAESFARRGDVQSHVSSEPRYLDHCRLKSDPGRNSYRVCAVENANDTCPDWSEAS